MLEEEVPQLPPFSCELSAMPAPQGAYPAVEGPEAAAWLALYRSLKSELLTLGELAALYGVNRNKARALLSHIAGVEMIGSRYRVPIAALPPEYFRQAGLIPPG